MPAVQPTRDGQTRRLRTLSRERTSADTVATSITNTRMRFSATMRLEARARGVTLVSRPAGGYPRVRTEEAARAWKISRRRARRRRARETPSSPRGRACVHFSRVATTTTTTDRASDSPRARAFTAAPKHTTVHVASRRLRDFTANGVRRRARRWWPRSERRDIQRALSAFAASRSTLAPMTRTLAPRTPTFFPRAVAAADGTFRVPLRVRRARHSRVRARWSPRTNDGENASSRRRVRRRVRRRGGDDVFGVPDALLAVPSFADATTRRDARALLVAIVHASPPRVVDAVSATLHARCGRRGERRRLVRLLGGFGFGFGTLVDDCATLADWRRRRG